MSRSGRGEGRVRRLTVTAAGAVVALGLGSAGAEARTTSGPGAAFAAPGVATEGELRAAWSDPRRRRIDLAADIVLRDCWAGDPIRESPYPLVLEGHGFTLRQACFEKRLLRQDGTGFLDVRRVTLTRGGSDGPGAALTSRGEIVLREVTVRQNLAEEPGGGVFSMRRITVHRSRLNGNLANDDGGALYARRGGVQVFDSIISNNVVDGSGGAIGSTGDILVVRSEVDGNTTDGDGGALYADEDGDVTVVDSHVDGSDADGPGGAIFTLDGDVAVLNSTLNGNRADDRGGAISGEGDVLVVNSTIARNLAVAHAGGGIWARGHLTLVNATVVNNYAEGEGGGLLSAGRTILLGSTVTSNIAPIGGDLGSAGPLSSFASILGPPVTQGVTGDTIPTRLSCRVYSAVSLGFNFVSDDTCRLTSPSDLTGRDPRLAPLEDDPRGFVRQPLPDSPVRRVIPSGKCVGRVPDPVPAGQLLSAYVDWDVVLSRDARGRVRDGGDGCDLGAVESPPVAGPSLRPPPPRGPPPRTPRGPGLRRGASEDLPAVGAQRPDLHPPSSRDPGSWERAYAPLGEARGPLVRMRDRLDRMRQRLVALRREVGRFDRLRGCLTELPVHRAGDPHGRWGFTYDERDGTGAEQRTALVPHQGAGPHFRLLDLSTRPSCLSRAPDPNGTGADARRARLAAEPRSATPAPRRHPSLRRLLARVARLSALAERIDGRAGRFDRWESCLRWQPITSAGDRAQDLGYVVSAENGSSAGWRSALDLDRTEWDDPDYQFLSVGGRDRPFGRGECGGEPGESVDRMVPRRSWLGRHPSRYDERRERTRAAADGRLHDLRQQVADLQEDLEDLVEPVQEVTLFDECMFTVGARWQPGYEYLPAGGGITHRQALTYQLRGPGAPSLNLLAFPGEEPPQIECNEDAGGESTDE